MLHYLEISLIKDNTEFTKVKFVMHTNPSAELSNLLNFA